MIRKLKAAGSDQDSSDFSRYHDVVYAKLSQSRTIVFSEEVSKEAGGALSAMLLFLDNEDSQSEITIYINSVGGDVTALLNIYDVMQMIKAPVKTICIGKAYSAAAVLLSAGSKGKRYATRHADVMIHGVQALFPQSEAADTVDLEIDYRMLQGYNRLLMEVLARHTGKDVEHVIADCSRDLFLDAEEALKYGIIDHII